MEGFTLVDAGVAGVIILSAILAYSRGFVREAMAIAGWIGAAILAFIFAPAAQPLIKELPVVGDFLRDSCELSIIAAAAGVFALGLIVAAIFTPLFSSAVQRSALGGIDQGAGFLFGVVRGIILVVIAFIVYDRAHPDGRRQPLAARLRELPGTPERGRPLGRAGLGAGAL
jgi:membrane protein required for colicin V production